MVRLERRYVRLGEILPYRFEGRTNVGRVEVPAFAVRDEKADGVARVVGNCKRLDVERPGLEVLTVFENRKIHFINACRRGNGVCSHGIGEKPRPGKTVVELRNSLYMVVVAVGEDRRNDRPEVDACGAAALQLSPAGRLFLME